MFKRTSENKRYEEKNMQKLNLLINAVKKNDPVILDRMFSEDVSDLFVENFPKSSSSYQCKFLELVGMLFNQCFKLSKDLVVLVLSAAGIMPNVIPSNQVVLMKADKCLVNALFNSDVARTIFESKCCHIIVRRDEQILKYLKDGTNYSDCFSYLTGMNKDNLELLLYFDLRCCLASSLQSPNLQKKWVEDAETSLIFLEVLKYATREFPLPKCNSLLWPREVLQILYNIYCHAQIYDVDIAQICVKECSRIVVEKNADDALKQNAIRLATVPSILSYLYPKLRKEEQKSIKTTKIYEDYDMRFVDAILGCLSSKIDKTSVDKIDLPSTIFTTLISLSKNHQAIRRYCRLKVIPSLKASHVEHPTDQGKILGKKILRFLTSLTNCKNLAAEFLFVLYKQNVDSLMKHGILVGRESAIKQIKEELAEEKKKSVKKDSNINHLEGISVTLRKACKQSKDLVDAIAASGGHPNISLQAKNLWQCIYVETLKL